MRKTLLVICCFILMCAGAALAVTTPINTWTPAVIADSAGAVALASATANSCDIDAAIPEGGVAIIDSTQGANTFALRHLTPANVASKAQVMQRMNFNGMEVDTSSSNTGVSRHAVAANNSKNAASFGINGVSTVFDEAITNARPNNVWIVGTFDSSSMSSTSLPASRVAIVDDWITGASISRATIGTTSARLNRMDDMTAERVQLAVMTASNTLHRPSVKKE